MLEESKPFIGSALQLSSFAHSRRKCSMMKCGNVVGKWRLREKKACLLFLIPYNSPPSATGV
jgi:hypothetical protein